MTQEIFPASDLRRDAVSVTPGIAKLYAVFILCLINRLRGPYCMQYLKVL